MIERLLAMHAASMLKRTLLRMGADDVIVLVDETKALQLKFANNLFSAVQSWSSADLEVFASVKKRCVSTTLKMLSADAVKQCAASIIEFAEALPPNDDFFGIARGPFRYRNIPGIYDSRISKISPDRIVAFVTDALKLSSSLGASRASGVLDVHSSSNFILTSGGVKTAERSTGVYLSIRAFTDKDASGHSLQAARTLHDFRPADSVKEAVHYAMLAASPKQGEAGEYDVLFTPLAVANLLDYLGSAASAFSVEAGLSCLAGKINKQVASDKLTFYDDATYPGGFGATNFDHEGVPTRRNKIIDRGVLKTYLHNTSTAEKYKTATTANAGLISPEPFNLVVEPGEGLFDEMVASIKHGLIVTNLWYTRFNNYEKGDFSAIPRDALLLVEDGKVKHSLRNLRISDNLLRVIRNIKAVGNKPAQIKAWEVETPVISPAVLVSGVTVTRPQ